MLVFELTMPGRGSWNNRWSQEDVKHYIVRPNSTVKDRKLLKEILETKHFYYRWDDGWTACVSVSNVKSNEANRCRKQSKGFCGYDWMVTSIIRKGRIEFSDEYR